MHHTQDSVSQVDANHQVQPDHGNRFNVEQEALFNTKHVEISTIMAQLGTQKTELDAATELLRARSKELRASILSKQAEIATGFQNIYTCKTRLKWPFGRQG